MAEYCNFQKRMDEYSKTLAVDAALPMTARRRSGWAHLPMLAMLTILSAFAPVAAPSSAADLPEPTGKVVLEISGEIANTNRDGVAVFDSAMLDALGRHVVTTSTVWTERGPHQFEGVLMRDVLKAVGATKATTVKAKALNDYQVEIPVADFQRYDVILASSLDGKTLTARDKGPLWIVYPRDDHGELADERMDQRWVWQLNRLELR